MKTFRFHAQQEQEEQVCQVLEAEGLEPLMEKTNCGVLVTAILPTNTSKRSIDRLLFNNQVPGAVDRRSKRPILKGEKWDVMFNPKAQEWFTWVYRGRFMGTFRAHYVHSCSCGCGGGYTTLIKRNGEVL